MCTYNFLPPHKSFHILLPSQILLSSNFLLFLMTFRGLPQAGSRADPGPRRGGLIRDHAGGRLRGRLGLSRAPARTPAISEEPLRDAGGCTTPYISGTSLRLPLWSITQCNRKSSHVRSLGGVRGYDWRCLLAHAGLALKNNHEVAGLPPDPRAKGILF